MLFKMLVALHVFLYRLTRGTLGGKIGSLSVLLLTTTGARTGQRRTTPMMVVREGDQLLVIASNAGAPKHPDWYHNVVANPSVTVEVGPRRFPARATVAEGAERERLYAAQATLMPGFAEYQRNTTRRIPVVILEPTGSA